MRLVIDNTVYDNIEHVNIYDANASYDSSIYGLHIQKYTKNEYESLIIVIKFKDDPYIEKYQKIINIIISEALSKLGKFGCFNFNECIFKDNKRIIFNKANECLASMYKYLEKEYDKENEAKIESV